jgi:ectoine hydroxylase-related dioxygenase (phytanoyl-CoA dioxygenase family)
MDSALLDQYQRDGYVALPGLLTQDEVAALNAEAAAICRGDRAEVIGADAQPSDDDESLMARVLAIHFPHKISPLVRATMRHPRIVEVLQALIGANLKAMQTMMFVKRAGKPGQAWHQDEFYVPTRDRSLCGVWIALDMRRSRTDVFGCIPARRSPVCSIRCAQTTIPASTAPARRPSFPIRSRAGFLCR